MLTPSLVHNTYLNSDEVCHHPLFLELLDRIDQFNSSSLYFIITHCSALGEEIPMDLIPFLQASEENIAQGAKQRRFVYPLNGWRIIFTFYPKKEVVSEHYALKNKMVTFKP